MGADLSATMMAMRQLNEWSSLRRLDILMKWVIILPRFSMRLQLSISFWAQKVVFVFFFFEWGGNLKKN